MGLGADLAGSVAEARKLLEQNRYQLCLTDMRLPDGDGLDLVRHIGEHCRDLPVAVITAYGSTENAVAALKAGAFDYLAKPVVARSTARAGEVGAQPAASRRRRGRAAVSTNCWASRPRMQQVRETDREAGAQPGAGLHLRRVGQRQGARGAPDPRAGAAARPAFRPGQLRRDSGEPDGERVLRLQQGRLHRRRERPRRLLPGGARRHAVSRRGGRSAAADAGEAAARDPGEARAQGRRHRRGAGGCAHHQRHASGPARRSSARASSARICSIGST